MGLSNCLLSLVVICRQGFAAAFDCDDMSVASRKDLAHITTLMKTLTDCGDLAVLLPLVAVVAFWLIAIRQPRALLWWLIAVALCMAGTAAFKIYFFVCPPLTDLHSPSGHTSLSTLVYGTLTLAVAAVVTGWKRVAVVASGTIFIAAIGISRILIHVHSVPEVLLGSLIGVAALALFASQFWPRRPTELRLRTMLVACFVLMVMLNGHDLHAEDLLHTIGRYLNTAGMRCV
jgi:membrane-associated phospholipid phosphatase